MPESRSSRQNWKIAAAESGTQSRIVDAARRHFLAHGFRNVTMDDLAVELGMSKKTFYAHFPGKVALVESVLGAKLDAAEADMERITSKSGEGFAGTLRDLLACLQQHTEEIKPPFLRDIRRDAPELLAMVEKRRSAMIERHFSRLLQVGRRDGTIRKDISVSLIIDILLGATQAVINPGSLEALALTPKSAYQAVISVILEGAMTSKGKAKP
ncbi:MAG TPA: TetR/AcrR family transcriptional regulator [Verrucomicrobiales bacterium]|nr:TetR/AcrR family transcriptional regulator [Verrucomicrobiales bacterium]